MFKSCVALRNVLPSLLILLTFVSVPKDAVSSCYGGGPGTYIRNTDLVVNSGQVVSVCPGTTIKFADGKRVIIKAGGFFGASGHLTRLSTYTGGWGGIVCEAGCQINLQGATISGVKTIFGSGYFVDIQGGSDFIVLKNNILHDPVPEYYQYLNYYPEGIRIRNNFPETVPGPQPEVIGNYINVRNTALRLTDWGFVDLFSQNNFVVPTNNGSGIQSSSNSYIALSTNELAWNDICGGTRSILASQYGVVVTPTVTHSVYINWFRSPGLTHVRAFANAYVSIYSGLFNPYPATISKDASSTVIIPGGGSSTSSCQPPVNSSSFASIVGDPETDVDHPERLGFLAGRDVASDAASKLNAAQDALNDRRFNHSAELLATVIEMNESPYSELALITLGHVYTRHRTRDIFRYVQSLADGPLRPIALRFFIHAHRLADNEPAVLDVAESLVREYPNTDHAFYGGTVLVYAHLAAGRPSIAQNILAQLQPKEATEDGEVRYLKGLLARALLESPPDDSVAVDTVEETNDRTSIDVYPNPFNPQASIIFSVLERGHIQLRVFDLLGREVATLVNEVLEAGVHSVVFDGSSLPTSTYFYLLETGAESRSGQLQLVK